MFVKDIMSKNLCTVKQDTIISEALDLMVSNNYHRLPVVDNEGYLVGLITEGLIRKDNSSSSLSVYELNYLFNKLKVKDLMKKKEDVKVINPNALVEEAALLLRENKVGCLPVVDENNKVLGIITHYDIFDSFIDILGYNRKGTRYTIDIKEDKIGVLNSISKCFVDENISISNLSVCNTSRGIEVIVIATGDNSSNCKDALTKAGYYVADVKDLIH